MEKNQTTSSILMVRPSNFGFNTETAANNAFQVNDTSLSVAEIQQKAMLEFDNFVTILRGHGINVVVAEDSPLPVKTDAVFPNNWITSHGDGTMVLYPMNAPSRRLERAENVIEVVETQFSVKKVLHLEHYEDVPSFLEGTGSMILDRVNDICYACLSPRTDLSLLEEWCDIMKHECVAFHAVDGQGQDIYHTNVMMALGETFVVICMDTVRDEAEKRNLIEHFEATKKEIIGISIAQMLSFAGNMLQVRNDAEQTFLVMSKQAYDSLNDTQIAVIQKHTQIVYADIKTIETYGGGSARCMLAEMFFDKK
jgi:hypothetical protein